jgi:hypothetical protein
LVYYRISKPLKECAQLPPLELTEYFESEEAPQIDIEVIPDYTFKINEEKINLNKDSYMQISNAFKLNQDEWSSKNLFNAFLNCLNNYMTKDRLLQFVKNIQIDLKRPGSENSKNMKINIGDLNLPSDFDFVSKVKLEALADIFLIINVESYSYISNMMMKSEFLAAYSRLEQLDSKPNSMEIEENDLLSRKIIKSKNFLLSCVKQNYISKIIDTLDAFENSSPTVAYDRIRIMSKKDRVLVDN